MPNLNQVLRTLRPLNANTQCGLFIADGGIRFWIFKNFEGTFAVQLDESSDRPAFSYYKLNSSTVCMGIWLGVCDLVIRNSAESSFRSRCGIIIKSGIRVFLKVNCPGGSSRRLMIFPYGIEEPQRFSQFYSDWSLCGRSDNGRIRFFQSPEAPPRLTEYPSLSPDEPPTRNHLAIVPTP